MSKQGVIGGTETDVQAGKPLCCPRLSELVRDAGRASAIVPDCGATGRAKVGRNVSRQAVISLKGPLKDKGAGR